MKVCVFGNNRDCEGYELVTVCATREAAVRLVREIVEGDEDEYHGNPSIIGMAPSEPLEDALKKFLDGKYDQVGVYDADDFTAFWIYEDEVVE